MRLQVHLSCAPTTQRRSAIAHDQWRTNVFPPPACWDLDSAEPFDVVGEHVPPEQVKQVVLVSDDLGRHAAWLPSSPSSGSTRCSCTMSARTSSEFIECFGEHGPASVSTCTDRRPDDEDQ